MERDVTREVGNADSRRQAANSLLALTSELRIVLGAYTIGKKAVKFGYKRYGIPGAVASGGAALAGYVAVRRALKSSTNSNDVASAINAGEIKRAVEREGLAAIQDRETLDSAIDREKLDGSVDMDEVQSSTAEESEDIVDSPDETDDEKSSE